MLKYGFLFLCIWQSVCIETLFTKRVESTIMCSLLCDESPYCTSFIMAVKTGNCTGYFLQEDGDMFIEQTPDDTVHLKRTFGERIQVETRNSENITTDIGMTIAVFTKCCNAVKAACEDGWIEFCGSCYLFSDNALSWHQAADFCLSRVGHLVRITSTEEMNFIKTVVDQFHYWIDLTDQVNEGEWLYSSSPMNVSFTNWERGQPDNVYNGDCALLSYHSNFEWDDVYCDAPRNYICEMRSKYPECCC